jgi:hypothetical protein
MQLTLSDRLLILSCLPKESNFATAKVIDAIMQELGVTEAEQAQCGFIADEQGVRWDMQTAPLLEYEFTGPQTKLIVTQLEQLNKDEKLTVQHIPLCEKFDIE